MKHPLGFLTLGYNTHNDFPIGSVVRLQCPTFSTCNPHAVLLIWMIVSMGLDDVRTLCNVGLRSRAGDRHHPNWTSAFAKMVSAAVV